MARILVCGTLAYDTIGHFDSALTPATRNVKLDSLHDSPGGCAMNIAYGLTRLGQQALPLVYVGDDYAPMYQAHVCAHRIDEHGIIHEAGSRCARGIVLTGNDGAQFTAFHPGPDGRHQLTADLLRVTAAERFDALVIAPDVPEKMLQAARCSKDIALRVWCPGQYAEHLEAEQIMALCATANVVVANRHEWRVLRSRAPLLASARRHALTIVTNGARPVMAFPGPLRMRVPFVPPAEQVDPTGCGDAFVAGLTDALLAGRRLPDVVAAGTALAARCLRQRGAQAY